MKIGRNIGKRIFELFNQIQVSAVKSNEPPPLLSHASQTSRRGIMEITSV